MLADDRYAFEPPPPKGRLRAFGLSLLAHAMLLAALSWGVSWKSEPVTLSAEVELWSAVPQEAAPKLEEVPPEAPTPPEPAPPAPRPLPPVQTQAQDADIVLAKDKLRRQKEKQLALEKQAQAKLKADKADKLKQDKLAKEKTALEAKKKAALDAKRKLALKEQQEKLENQKIEQQRETNLKRIAGMAGATGSSSAQGSAQKSSGPSASYSGRLAALFKKNINFSSPESISGNPKATVEVRVSATGLILSSRLLTTSGVPAWDSAVLRAVEKTERIPADENGSFVSVFPVNFGPKD